MPASYPDTPRSHRPFIVTPYLAGPLGELEAQMPAVCPLGVDSSGSLCSLRLHHLRARKSGPCHRLAVVVCRTHGRCFTLYPPGHRPFGRQPLVRLSPDGQELAGSVDEVFIATPFEAALDARSGRAWARETDGRPPERWWSTQGRHLSLAARVCGVAQELAERVRESIGAVLSVGVLVLRERSRARGYRQVGQAVCDVLARLQRGSKRARQLLLCGHLIGRWGEPLHWDARRGVLRRSPFPSGLQPDST